MLLSGQQSPQSLFVSLVVQILQYRDRVSPDSERQDRLGWIVTLANGEQNQRKGLQKLEVWTLKKKALFVGLDLFEVCGQLMLKSDLTVTETRNKGYTTLDKVTKREIRPLRTLSIFKNS